ncbi:zinc ribbon domain-containing protein [bacterium]|nr:zinc ribbon domain-containing protein [bacterium]
MPIYEYFCSRCEQVHEVTQRISDDALESCPVCHHGDVRRLISRSNFQLKGSGWYTTDYARKSANGGATTAPAAKTDAASAPACASGACGCAGSGPSSN